MTDFTIRVPLLTTPRLLLRGFAETDFEDYAGMLADQDVVRHLGDGRPMSRTDAWRHLATVIGNWSLRGFGLWEVE